MLDDLRILEARLKTLDAIAILTLDERKAKGLDLKLPTVAELNKAGVNQAPKLARDSGSQRGALPSATPALYPM